jgi:hypothetical protein
MTSRKDAQKERSSVNAVALQNLRAIRRRINDNYWKEAAERRIRKDQRSKVQAAKPNDSYESTSDASQYETVFRFALIAVVNDAVKKGKIDRPWNFEMGEPLPEHPRTRKHFAEATGIDDGHLRALEEDNVDFTLNDAIQIARVGNMDLATFLTPPLEDLENEIHFPLELPRRYLNKLYMYEWLMWLRGYRPLPDQNPEEFLRLTHSPSLSMRKLDDPRTFRGHDSVQKDRDRLEASPLYLGGFLANTNNPNPFNAPISPFEKAPKQVQSTIELNKVLIQCTLLLATQLKKVLITKQRGSLKSKRAQFVNLMDFIRYAITALVRLLVRAGK